MKKVESEIEWKKVKGKSVVDRLIEKGESFRVVEEKESAKKKSVRDK
jgi:hypothetical protein